MDSDTTCSSQCTEESEEVQKIVLHVYDDESKEFTSLTTYHGMIRIYTSKTWPSRIFWTLVVVICLSLFMIQGGTLLRFYYTHPTTFKISQFKMSPSYLPSISICPLGFKENDDLYDIIIKRHSEKSFSTASIYIHNSTYDLVNRFSYSCSEVLDTIETASRKKINFCQNAQRIVSDAGICYTFKNWKLLKTNKIKILFSSKFTKEYLLRLHDRFTDPSNINSQIWVRPRSVAKLSFSLIENMLLSKDNWGTCRNEVNNDLYNFNKCSEKCVKQLIRKSCSCNAFYEAAQEHCTLGETMNCTSVKNYKCNCQAQCYFMKYKLSPLIAYKNQKNHTTSAISLQLNSNTLTANEQYLRFKQIDLMSYVGGLMGLFLGMSCVTLLEVFVYLLKAVFGTFNDIRHKMFVDRLLGETVDDLNRSHEEIIITKKIETNQKVNEDNVHAYSLMEKGNHENIEHNQHQTHIKRMSTYTMQNDHGLKIQLYRPITNLRRNSTYFDACDF